MARILWENFEAGDFAWMNPGSGEIMLRTPDGKPYCVRCGKPIKDRSSGRLAHTEDEICHYVGPHCKDCLEKEGTQQNQE